RRRPSSSPTTTGRPRPSRSRKPGGRSWPHERRLDGAQQGAEAPALPVPGAGMSVFEQHKLGNGLRILSANMPQVPSVTCMIMLAAGSRYETPDTNGIAHFAEHMFFKGTERRPTARDIGMEVDGLGGEFNAFTSKEYTGYYVRCASDYREQALDVLVDMLRNSKFESAEIEREKVQKTADRADSMAPRDRALPRGPDARRRAGRDRLPRAGRLPRGRRGRSARRELRPEELRARPRAPGARRAGCRGEDRPRR